jgi:hypothetical protein
MKIIRWYISVLLLLTACNPQIHSIRNNDDALWHNDTGFMLHDGTKSIHYVDSIPCPSKYYMLYSDKSRYTYFSVDSIDAKELKEGDILVNNIANLLVENISSTFKSADSRCQKLFGNDDVNNSKLILDVVNKNGICKCVFEHNPTYFRILLIRGDFLENNLHYYHPDGMYQWPLQLMDWAAYYKVYVPIWE